MSMFADQLRSVLRYVRVPLIAYIVALAAFIVTRLSGPVEASYVAYAVAVTTLAATCFAAGLWAVRSWQPKTARVLK